FVAVTDVLAGGIGHVAEDLVVGAVFANDIDDVLDGAVVADFGGDDRIGFGDSVFEFAGRVRGILLNLLGVIDQLPGRRLVDERNGAVEERKLEVEGFAYNFFGIIGFGGKIRR